MTWSNLILSQITYYVEIEKAKRELKFLYDPITVGAVICIIWKSLLELINLRTWLLFVLMINDDKRIYSWISSKINKNNVTLKIDDYKSKNIHVLFFRSNFFRPWHLKKKFILWIQEYTRFVFKKQRFWFVL